MQFTVFLVAIVALFMPTVSDIAPDSVKSFEPAMSAVDNEGCPAGWTVLYVGTSNMYDENGDGIICRRPNGGKADGYDGHPIDNKID